MLARAHFAELVERGTNPTEFHYIRLRLREAGAQVTCVGVDRLAYELEDHSTGYAGALIGDVTAQMFDGVFIPGGLGPEKLRQNGRVVALVRDCYARGKLCAAICHGQQVLISAGLMRGVRATAAWSMQDDLRAVGAIVPPGERAVRDGQIVTAMFPQDLPAFFDLVFDALVEERCRRLVGQRWGIVVDDASDGTQMQYLRLRVLEEGGVALLLGRRAGQKVRLGSPAWEWGEMGWHASVDRALPDPGAVGSCDTEAELDSQAIAAGDLDGLLLPGGLATWMVRGHPGLKQLIQEMDAAGKPIAAVERGAKLLLLTGVLDGRAMTCAPEMRDDVRYAFAPIEYQDVPVVRDENLLTCQGTEDLPALMRLLIAEYGAGLALTADSGSIGHSTGSL